VTFAERFIRADGFEIRYLESGDGPPLVCFHGAGGLRLSRAHEILGEGRRVIAFETPGFGASPANDRSTSLRELAGTMLAAVDAPGITPPRDPDLEAAMRDLGVATLVLFGTEGRLTPPELGRCYRELLPNCHFVIVYDAAHAIYDDRPEALAAIVGDFLEHRAEFVVRRESRLLYP
jgi:pimeloyl-ACP methyl ester carboxylesterase